MSPQRDIGRAHPLETLSSLDFSLPSPSLVLSTICPSEARHSDALCSSHLTPAFRQSSPEKYERQREIKRNWLVRLWRLANPKSVQLMP